MPDESEKGLMQGDKSPSLTDFTTGTTKQQAEEETESLWCGVDIPLWDEFHS